MILYTEDGRQIQGDMIRSAVIRSDASPVPVTLEAEIRFDEDLKRKIVEGKTISLANGDELSIVYVGNVSNRMAQGRREMGAQKVIALINSCKLMAYVRERALIAENATLFGLYRAAGCSLKAVESDFSVSRFVCPVGGVPSFHVARILQEEGGIVRWKNGRLQFRRIADLFRQEPAETLADNAYEEVESEFLERHELPWFFSLNAAGEFVFGDRTKARSVGYSPFKTPLQLRNMSSALVHRRVIKTGPTYSRSAGDMIRIVGYGDLAVVTAVHVFESGTDGSGSNQYSRLWLAEKS